MRRDELVALVDLAPGTLSTLRGTLHRRGRWGQAGPRLDGIDGMSSRADVVGAIATFSIIGDGQGAGAGRDAVEPVTRVWFRSPNRWCLATGNVGHRPDLLDISDGDHRWVGTGATVTRQEPSPATPAATGLFGSLLAPGRLLGLFTFDRPAEAEVGGRPCARVVGRPRPGADGHSISLVLRLAGLDVGGPVGPDREDTWWFDATHGFVVRHRTAIGGEPAGEAELRDVVVDDPIGPARFRPPDGTTVRSEWEARLDHLRHLGIDTDAIEPGDHDAVQQALAGAGGGAFGRHPRPADRVRSHVPTGPPPDDPEDAERAITLAFRNIADTDPSGNDLTNVQAGHGLAPELEQARRRLPGATADNGRWEVDALTFLSPDQAAVWFTVEVAGRAVLPHHPGRAVLVGGRWLVEHATLAEVLARGGVVVRPPDER